MPRKVPVPRVTYAQTKDSSAASVDAVFDYLFELLINNKAKGTLHK